MDTISTMIRTLAMQVGVRVADRSDADLLVAIHEEVIDLQGQRDTMAAELRRREAVADEAQYRVMKLTETLGRLAP